MVERCSPLLLLALLSACGKGSDTSSSEQQSLAVVVPASDLAMEEAAETARARLSEFLVRLEKPAAKQTYAAVKAEMRSGESSEFGWIREVKSNGTVFTGSMGHGSNLKNVTIGSTTLEAVTGGEKITIPHDEILDWMLVIDGRVVGAFSLRAMRKKMSPAEREQFDKGVGASFD